jgi:uncharacterized membrane-anchored protein
MKILAAQGELRIFQIDALPANIGSHRPRKNSEGAFILAHSEKGHHHVLGGDVDVIEHTEVQNIGNQNLAMRTLYAIVKEPTSLRQTAANAHVDVMLEPGLYAIRADVEFDPFADQIREVQD